MLEELPFGEDGAPLRALAETVPHLAWVAAADGSTCYWNRRALEYAGLSAQEVLGYGWQRAIHPDDRAGVLAAWAEALRTGQPFSAEYRFRRADGTYRWHAGRALPLRDRHGHVVRWFGTRTDIDAQKRAEEALARDARLLGSVRDSIIVTDLEGTVTYWNEGATRLFGWTAQEMMGQPLTNRVPESARAEMAAAIRANALGREFAGEWHDYRKDGSRVWIDARISRITDEAGQPVGILGLAHDISDRKRDQDALRASEGRFRAIIEKSFDAVLLMGADGTLLYASPSFTHLLGYTAEEVLGQDAFALVHPDDRRRVNWLFAQLTRAPGGTAINTHRCRSKVGDWRWLDVRFTNLLSDPGVQAVVINFRDVTDQRQAEEERGRLETQLRQAQKMEAIGRLAGGVAHDFNNLLTVISGYGSFLLNHLSPGDPMREMVEEMTKAGDRAAGLTRQLLAFSRKQVVALRVLDLNTVVADLKKMLRRVIGEDVDLAAVLQANLGGVKADAGQLEQVLLNLVVNARDAMPRGGKLTLETKDVVLDEGYTRVRPGVRPGAYVLLAVSDTGCGMTPEVKARIFEPFFTTKEAGKGTGLGLATVFGIVKQAGGHIEVYSEMGIGTTFKVYLPRAEEPPGPAESHPAVAPAARGSETVLLVEDEEAVRALSGRVLRSNGYIVLAAAGGEEAVRLCREHPGPIQLVVTDVVMPGMGGRQLVEQLRALRPGLGVLYLSGYADDAVVRHGVLEDEVHFLQKPFTPAALAHKVREVLDAPPAPETPARES